MKTFKQLVNEVAEPKAGDEKRFKAKHMVAKYDHPAAEEDQFTADKVKKDKSKLSGHKDGEDEEVYEEAQPKWKVQIGKKHYTVVGRNTAEANRKAQALAKKEGNAGVGGKIQRVSEEVELDEAFKMGSMKLKDGKTVKLSKEEADAVNNLFNELNSSNKKRMQEEMMKNKSGFDKVLRFAKEAM
jgi:hypothetical protein